MGAILVEQYREQSKSEIAKDLIKKSDVRFYTSFIFHTFKSFKSFTLFSDS